MVGVSTSQPDSEAARAMRGLLLPPGAMAGAMPTAMEMAGILMDHPLIGSLLAPDVIAVDGRPAVSVALSFSASPIAQV